MKAGGRPATALVMRLRRAGIKRTEIARRLGTSREAVNLVIREAEHGPKGPAGATATTGTRRGPEATT